MPDERLRENYTANKIDHQKFQNKHDSHLRSAMIVSLAVSFLSLTSFHALSAAFDDVAFCTVAETFQKNGEADVGKMVDKFTRNDGMAVLCGNRVVEFKKFLFANESEMREGWKERKANQWDTIYCESAYREAIQNGWTIAVSMITKDGKRFWHAAKCSE